MTEDKTMIEKHCKTGSVSRRNFIKKTGVVIGGASMANAVAGPALLANEPTRDGGPSPWLPDQWDLVTDVLVVGSGTGCAAAIEAAEKGATVVLLEKQNAIGGTVRVSAGGIIAAGTSVQKDLGIEDSPGKFYDYLLALGGIEVDPELCKILAEGSVEVYEWCKTYLGCKFPSKLLSDHIFYHAGLSKNDPGRYFEWKTGFPNTPPRTHWVDPPTGETYVAEFRKKLKDLGVKILTQTPLMELVYDPVRKEVLGGKAESKGKPFFIKAKKGVILAAGGHGHNNNLVRNLELCAPTLAAGKIYRSPHFTGDGIVSGMKAGGWFWPAVESGPDANPYMPSSPKTFYDVFETLPRVYVNKNGLRYINEQWYQAVQAQYLCEQPERLGWCILDDRARNAVGWDFSRSIKKGKIAEGDTIKDLAVKAGIDPDGLESTVRNWNRYVDKGKDPEWHRQSSYSESFKPLKTPPYYATPIEIYLVAGYGPGLKINAKAQVVDIDQNPVQRLYATGADAAGVMPSMYIGCGSALTIGFLFGRIAGKNAAEESVWA